MRNWMKNDGRGKKIVMYGDVEDEKWKEEKKIVKNEKSGSKMKARKIF